MWALTHTASTFIWRLSKVSVRQKYPFPTFRFLWQRILPKPPWHHLTLIFSLLREKWLNWLINLKRITSPLHLISLFCHSESKLPTRSRTLLCSCKPDSPQAAPSYPCCVLGVHPGQHHLRLRVPSLPNSGPVSRTTWLSHWAQPLTWFLSLTDHINTLHPPSPTISS